MATKLRVSARVANKLLTVFALLGASTAMASCGRTQASLPQIPINVVMEAIRGYNHGSQPLAATAQKNPGAASPGSDELYDTDGPYQAHLGVIFAQSDFAQLEKEAREVRTNKTRLKGGVWKLSAFYEGVSKPSADDRASDSDWESHIAAVRKWIAAYPDSAAAHTALAETYINYAWAARGTGYANTVSGSGWNLFGQRIELGKAALLEAAREKEKCPYWYEAMQQVALAEGWDKQQARELLDQAAAFEPTFYHFYREYANFLLPKWRGEEGETQEFAEEISRRLGGSDGSIVYFEIASLLACQCDEERDSLEGMDWARVKRGYAELRRLYGTSNLKMNRFAYMSFVAGDKDAARETIAALADAWNPKVWQIPENFKSAKDWAARP